MDPRTLLETPKIVTTSKVPPGEYWHAGLEKGLLDNLSILPHLPKEINLQFGIDGLPVSRSSKAQIWPILVKITKYKPFVVGIYYGDAKPASAESFLRPFVNEVTALLKSGIVMNGVCVSIKIDCFVCDAPARAFIKGIYGHNSTYGCEKCCVEGTFDNHHMFYDSFNATL